jgi:hypothetical protein
VRLSNLSLRWSRGPTAEVRQRTSEKQRLTRCWHDKTFSLASRNDVELIQSPEGTEEPVQVSIDMKGRRIWDNHTSLFVCEPKWFHVNITASRTGRNRRKGRTQPNQDSEPLPGLTSRSEAISTATLLLRSGDLVGPAESKQLGEFVAGLSK